MDADRSSVNRREFFRRFLSRGLEQVEQAGHRFADRLTPDVVPIIHQATPVRYLRPPGALPEAAFADTCSRCAKCVEVCPAQCIALMPDRADGLPHIVPRESSCVVCDELACMHVCPTGALGLVERHEIDMGFAAVDQQRCLRRPAISGSEQQGEDCRVCLDDCHIGPSALGLDHNGLVEVRDGCVGCGVCEQHCPTEPASIWVVPKPESTLS